MRVLIVVCAYNEEKGILDCLKSIDISIKSLNRSDVVYDVVCVDNSSTDNTKHIAEIFTGNKRNFSVITIKHCSLSISRNSYKLYDNYDYIAYLDGDGGVDGSWCSELANIILTHKADIISGPVFEHKSSAPNLIWDFYYDSELSDSSTYLIGANMIFSSKLLEVSGGFPSLFYSRGDETGLLLRLNKLGVEYQHHFSSSLIAYNCFDKNLTTFFKTQYQDGKRSDQVYRLSNVLNSKRTINFLYKFNSVASVLLVIPVSIIDVKFGVFLLLWSYLPHFFRTQRYHKIILKKLIQKRRVSSMAYALAVLSSRYLFDLGYLVSYFTSKENLTLDRIEKPVVVSK